MELGNCSNFDTCNSSVLNGIYLTMPNWSGGFKLTYLFGKGHIFPDQNFIQNYKLQEYSRV